jgi:hypothetical protein
MVEMAELRRLLPQLRGLVENQAPRPQTPATPRYFNIIKTIEIATSLIFFHGHDFTLVETLGKKVLNALTVTVRN